MEKPTLSKPREQQFDIALKQFMELYNDVPLNIRIAVLATTIVANRADVALFQDVFAHFQRIYKGLELKGTLVYLNGECKFNIEGYNLLRNLTELCDIIQYELK